MGDRVCFNVDRSTKEVVPVSEYRVAFRDVTVKDEFCFDINEVKSAFNKILSFPLSFHATLAGLWGIKIPAAGKDVTIKIPKDEGESIKIPNEEIETTIKIPDKSLEEGNKVNDLPIGPARCY